MLSEVTTQLDKNTSLKKKTERTCVACRKTDSNKNLLRVVSSQEHGLVVDWKRNLGGRGAHVCYSRLCIERAVGKKLFDKTLKTKINYPDSEKLIKIVSVAILKRIATLLSSCIGSKKLFAGTDSTLQAISKTNVYCLLLADDASQKKRFQEKAKQNNILFFQFKDKVILGELVGRLATGVVAIGDKGIAVALGDAINNYNAF